MVRIWRTTRALCLGARGTRTGNMLVDILLAGLGALIMAIFVALAFMAGWAMAQAERDARIWPNDESGGS